MGRNKKR